MNTTIKKGDRFLCIQDFFDKNLQIVFKKNNTYYSEQNDILICEKTKEKNLITNYEDFSLYFQKITEPKPYFLDEVIFFTDSRENPIPFPQMIDEFVKFFEPVKTINQKQVTISESRFDEIVSAQCETIQKSLVEKGKEYRRNNDPLHNFRQGAKVTGQPLEKVLKGMALKHEISINDMIDDLEKGILPSPEMLEEKFKDAINYLILLKACFVERIE